MKPCYFFFAALAFGTISQRGAAAAEPSLKDFLSAPFLSSLVGAANGNRFVWIANRQGQRNVWFADGPAYVAKPLTRFDEDDGQEIAKLDISEDGRIVAFARGGDANPADDPKGAKQEVWIATVSGRPRVIGEGDSPAVSPDGKWVTFVKGSQLFLSATQGSSKPQELLKTQGKLIHPKWSPDGERIAFTSSRGEARYSFVGVYDIKTKKLSWMSPSVDRDREPTWSPDGKQLAFLRIGARGAEEAWFPPDKPFSIWIADPRTGTGHIAWKSPNETDGHAQMAPSPALFWTADDLLVFYWEKDGWMRLYSFPASGGEPAALSPAECEAENAAVAKNGTDVLFTSNCKDIDRRHIWSVPAAGGLAKLLTSDKSLQWNPTFADSGRKIAYLQADWRVPAQPVVWSKEEGGPPTLVESDFVASYPSQALVEPQPVEIKSADGTVIHGQLFLPRSGTGSRRPALVYMHGGPIRQMILGWHYMGYYHYGYAMNQFMASHGYVTLSVNYRCGTGYGRAFRHNLKCGPYGATEYQDIVAAGQYLQSRADVDAKRIGLWGGSYGGYLTAMGLARDSKMFAAGVDFHGVHDWVRQIRDLQQVSSPLQRDASLSQAIASSPISSLKEWTSPVLFIHGDEDPTVNFVQTTDLVSRLREIKRVHVENLVFPGEIHFFLRHNTWLRAFQATSDFFDKFLRSQMQAAR